MRPSEESLRAEEACKRLETRCLPITHELYPPSLRAIPDPPAMLFCRGSLESLQGNPAVAVIGSRRCSMYGRKSARSIAAALAGAGACVVSGLARGIDGEAHRGAVDAGGATCAVFAGGLDTVYPPEHRSLAERILRGGCLLSEYPPGFKPARYTFAERNRIISGLVSAVVVVEAGERSGTMITVGTALDQGREVYAVPGEMGRSTSRGTNRLLRDGAGIVLSPEELLGELGLVSSPSPVPGDHPLLLLTEGAGKTPGALSLETGLPIEEVTAALVKLEMEGRVIRRPGNVYASLTQV